jgi:hypothetical protein
MYQCILCEDWFHGSCLARRCAGVEAEARRNEDGEFVCIDCFAHHPPLWRYHHASIPVLTGDDPVDVVGLAVEAAAPPLCSQVSDSDGVLPGTLKRARSDASNANRNDDHTDNDENGAGGAKRACTTATGDDIAATADPAAIADPAATGVDSDRQKLDTCTAPPAVSGPGFELGDILVPRIKPLVRFFPRGWRETLCSCSTCSAGRDAAGLGFLTDESKWPVLAEAESDDDDDDGDDNDDDGDDVNVESGSGQGSGDGISGAGAGGADQHQPHDALLNAMLGAFATLPSSQQVLGLTAYEALKSRFREFARPFATTGRTITERDIRDFFASLPRPGDDSSIGEPFA